MSFSDSDFVSVQMNDQAEKARVYRDFLRGSVLNNNSHFIRLLRRLVVNKITEEGLPRNLSYEYYHGNRNRVVFVFVVFFCFCFRG